MPLVNQTFDQLLDFTRTSSATFVGSDGLIQNTPASVNLLTWTQQFDNAAWPKNGSTISANSTVAPDGTSTADTINAPTGDAGGPRVYQRPAITGGTTYTISSYFKASGTNFAFLSMRTNSVNWAGAEFNLSTGTVSRNAVSGNVAYVGATISSAGDGWYRCTVTVTPTDTIAANLGFIFFGSSDGTSAFVGGYPSFTNVGTESIFIWGAQLEAVPDANLVLGSELVTNPGPFADTTGWTASLGTIAAVSSSLVLTVPVGGSARAVSSAMSGLTIGAVYRINVTGVAGDAVNKSIRITTNADGSTGALFTQSISGTSITYTFVATATTHYLALIVTGGTLNQTFSVSQASVKQITAITGMPSTYTRNNGGVFPVRFDYDPVTLAAKGLLAEEQRTNLFFRSEDFTSGAWSRGDVTITANSLVSPDGTANADTFTATATGTSSFVSQATTVTATTAYTTSLFVKKGTADFANLTVYDSVNGNRYWFNLNTGAVASTAVVNAGLTNLSARIENFGNGWFRCVVTCTTKSLTSLTLFATLTDADASLTLTNGKTGYLYGAQLEAGAFATSYIPTVASQVTRTFDNCSIVAPNFAPWYNAAEGSFVVEVSSVLAGGRLFYSADNGTTAARMFAQSGTTAADTLFRVVDTTDQAAIGQNSVAVAGAIVKMASAYKANDFAVSTNGAAVSTDTSGTVPIGINSLKLGQNVALSGHLCGHIRSIRYYPVRLSNSQLQALTA